MGSDKRPKMSLFSVIFLVTFILPCFCTAFMVDNNPYRHFERLDPNGRYDLEWLVNWEEKRVIFNVTAQTTGYIGFGLSRRGKMSGADIVIGGVMPNGEPYFSDRHAINNQVPVEDDQQDWILLSARETGSTTYLSFTRPFDTCDDEQDIEIHGDVLSLIWAFGENDDEIQYHFQHRGRFDTYLLDPDLTPRIIQSEYRKENPNALGDTKIWSISDTVKIPPKETTYLCSIQKAPVSRKNHIIGYNTILPSALSRKHIHHFAWLRCHAPEGVDPASLFQRFHDAGTKEECYTLAEPIGEIPTQYCREVVYVWEVNGKPFFLPENYGIPMAETGDDFYLLQMHLDNPDMLAGIRVNYRLEVFHTANKLREHDVGTLFVGEFPSPSIMVPPNSIEHAVYGQCGSGCTSKILPDEGIHIFAANLHTHLAGRGMRLLHIRNGRELPWITYDNNYNFDYQQTRVLRRERTVLPGDTLILRCAYGNTDANGSVTTGGLSTRREMCHGFLYYYNRLQSHSDCRSDIRSDTYRQFIDIYNTTWSSVKVENVVTSPERNFGLTVTEVGNLKTNWTIQKRTRLQTLHRVLPQISQCPSFFLAAGDDASQTSGSSGSEGRRVSSTSPPLRRYDPIVRGRMPAGPKTTTTSPIPDINAEIRSAQQQIENPEWEFVSTYPTNIVPYERTRVCRNTNDNSLK